jgi:predicted small lipoprotein YifL
MQCQAIGLSPLTVDLLWCRQFRSVFVTPSAERRVPRLALLAALVATLGLTGCGRKGPLDPPPSASVAEPAEAAPQRPGGTAGLNPLATPAKPASGEAFGINGEPIAPKGAKKSLFLDWFID